MKQFVRSCLALSLLLLLFGCTHPSKRTGHLNLGMTADDVREAMGKPYSVRAAKIFEDEETTMVWEYWPPILAQNTDKVQVIFVNGRVVQWGVQGDYNTGGRMTGTAAAEYNPSKGR